MYPDYHDLSAQTQTNLERLYAARLGDRPDTTREPSGWADRAETLRVEQLELRDYYPDQLFEQKHVSFKALRDISRGRRK